MGVTKQFEIPVQAEQTVLLCALQAVAIYCPEEQGEQVEQPLCPWADVNAPPGHALHEVEPDEEVNIPIEQGVQLAEPLLVENVPGGHMVQPHKFALETPTFGLALYI